LPYVDTKVAASLCIRGPCIYILSEAIPESLVYYHVVPEIYEQFGPQVALVLGNALLFTCFTASVSHLVPLFIKDRVLLAYAAAGLEEEPNPVSRRLVLSLETMRMCLSPKCQEKKRLQGRKDEGPEINWRRSKHNCDKWNPM
jgi:hypothetical protein